VPLLPGHEEASPPASRPTAPPVAGSCGVPNLYPAFEGDEPFVVANRARCSPRPPPWHPRDPDPLPRARRHLGDDLREQSGLVMAALRDRLDEHSQRPNLRYTQAIVNSGARPAPHSSIPTASCSHVLRAARARRGAGPLRRFAAAASCAPRSTPKRASGTGHLRRRPGGGRLPVLECGPLRDARHPPRALLAAAPQPPEDLVSVGRSIRACLNQLRDRIGDVAYNIVFHSAPYRLSEPFHWHAHIWRRPRRWRGSRWAPASPST